MPISSSSRRRREKCGSFDRALSQSKRANVCALALLEDRTICVEDVYHSPDYDFSGPRRYDARNGYRTRSMLVVPGKLKAAVGPASQPLLLPHGQVRMLPAIMCHLGLTQCRAAVQVHEVRADRPFTLADGGPPRRILRRTSSSPSATSPLPASSTTSSSPRSMEKQEVFPP